MKKTILLSVSLLLACATSQAAWEKHIISSQTNDETEKKEAKKDSLTFTVIKENPITSIKNQHRSGTCWAFSSLGYFEAELLRIKNKEYNLCEAFLAEKTYIDRAEASVRLHGDISYAQAGSFYDAVYCLRNYGICP